MDFRVLGPLEVVVGDRPVELSRGAKELLALLLVRFGSVVSADAVADALWGDELPGNPQAALHTQVSRLRSALEPDRERGEPPQVVVTRASGYVLAIDEGSVDAARFRQFVAEASAMLATDPAGAAARCDEAMGLWRGPPFVDFADREFAQAEIIALNETRAVAQEIQITAEVGAGRHREVVPRIEAILAEEPFREVLWGQLMLAQYRSGNQVDALRAYQRARAVLGEELGLEPSRQLQQLEEAILVQDPSLDADITVLLDRTETVTNVPVPIGTFVGRDRQVVEVNEALDRHRLVTLTGPGGIGKSRLAIEAVLARPDDEFDLMGFVRLDGLTDADQVEAVVMKSLGLFSYSSAGEDELVAFLRSRRSLLILDGCETVLARAASLARLLLEECGGLRILATSRQRLGLAGETVRPVALLHLPEPDSGLDSEAIEMFLSRRGGEVWSDLQPEEKESLAQLVTDLDGLPLAIELVAAASQELTLTDIVTGLDALLASDEDRTAAPQLQSLRASLDWSWAALTDAQRGAVAELSVFEGHWDLAAAAALLSVEESAAAVLMMELSDLAVVASEFESGAVSGSYRMTHIQRRYARRKLAQSGRGEDTMRRHAEYYSRRFSGRDEYSGLGAVASQALNRNQRNLRAALEWSLEHQPKLGLRVASALAVLLMMQARRIEAGEVLDRALAVNPDSTTERAEALAWWALASHPRTMVRRPTVNFDHPFTMWNLYDQEEPGQISAHFEAALARCQEAIEIVRELKVPLLEVAGLAIRAVVLGSNMQYDQAGAAITEALAVAEATGDTTFRAFLLCGQANLHIANGDLKMARACGTDLLAAAVHSDWFLQVRALEIMARVARAENDPAAAYETLAQAPKLIPPGFGPGEAIIQTELGRLAAECGELDIALHHLGIGLRVARRVGYDRGIADIRDAQGYVEFVAGRLDTATEYSERAASLHRIHGFRVGIAYSEAALGHIALASGDFTDATGHYQRSLQTWTQPNHSQALAFEGLAAIAALSGEDERAAVLFGAADSERARISFPAATDVRVIELRARVRSRLGDNEMDRLLASSSDTARDYALGDLIQDVDITQQ